MRVELIGLRRLIAAYAMICAAKVLCFGDFVPPVGSISPSPHPASLTRLPLSLCVAYSLAARFCAISSGLFAESQQLMGTPSYMAPESILHGMYGKEVDW